MKKFKVFILTGNSHEIEADGFGILDGIIRFYVGEEDDKKVVAAFNVGFVEGVREIRSE